MRESGDTIRRDAAIAEVNPNHGLSASDGFGGGDAQLPAGGRARLSDDDVDIDIAAERDEQAEQALQGILAEVAPQEPRHVGPGKAEQATGLGLGSAALAQDVVDAADQLRLEQVGVGVGVPEVGEDVATAAFDSRVGCGHDPATFAMPEVSLAGVVPAAVGTV